MNLASLRPAARGTRLRLLGVLWCLGLVLEVLVAYPIYRPLANSRLLHGTTTDQSLFAPGAELLWDLVDSRSTLADDLAAAISLVIGVVAILSVLGSAVAWVGISRQEEPFVDGFLRQVSAVLPGFTQLFLLAVTSVGILVAGFWHLCRLLGAWLLPWLGERNTDLVLLAFLALLVAGIGLLLILADTTRAVIVARTRPAVAPSGRDIADALTSPRLVLTEALWTAFELFVAHPLRIIAQVSLRLGLAGSLRGLGLWWIAREGWLHGSMWAASLALGTNELLTLAALALRLDWIAWLTRTCSSQVAQSPDSMTSRKRDPDDFL